MNRGLQLIFDEVPMSTKVGRKHPRHRSWQVKNKDHGTHIGWVEWFPRFRQNIFIPRAGAGFGTDSLQELSNFCEKCDTERTASTSQKSKTFEQRRKEHMGHIRGLVRAFAEAKKAVNKGTDLYGKARKHA